MKFDYSDIASKVYSRSFFAVCVFILLSLGIAIFNQDDIVEIMKIVLAFVRYALALYVVPVSLQIAGEYAKLIYEILGNKEIKRESKK
jgi:hypothetical protein